jgi:hypothetical protein
MLFNFFEIVLKGRAHWKWSHCVEKNLILTIILACPHPKDSISFGMKIIKGPLILYMQNDEQATGNTQA